MREIRKGGAMRRVSADSAQLTEEYGIRIGRWTQYPETEAFPFDAMWCVLPPGARAAEDRHPEMELAVVVNGSAVFESGETTIDAAPGAAVLLSSNERHVVRNRSDESPLVVLSVYWLPPEAGETGDGG
jgi:quercetin dioxygenase-like cupin family protein